MRQHYTLSTREVLADLSPYTTALAKHQLDGRQIVAYSILLLTADYLTVVGYLRKDLSDLKPDWFNEDPSEFMRMTHTCVDLLVEASSRILPIIQRTLGLTGSLFRVERFLGDDIVVSVEVPSV